MTKHLLKIGPAKRAWINLVPCLTVWVRLPGGKEP